MTPRRAAFVIVAAVACLSLEAQAPQPSPPAKNEPPAPKPAALRGKVELTLNHPLREPLSAGLTGVLVHVSPPPEGIKYQAPSETAVVALKTSVGFVPRVIGVQCRQEIRVETEGPDPHNFHPLPRKQPKVRSFLPHRSKDHVRITNEEFDPPIMVTCDVHPYETGYWAVFPHPFFAVTDESAGFQIPDLPPGRYKLTAWHETLGKQIKEIEVLPGITKEVRFEFNIP